MSDFLDEKRQEIQTRMGVLEPALDEYRRLDECMGIKQNYLYRALPSLVRGGKVSKQGTSLAPNEDHGCGMSPSDSVLAWLAAPPERPE